MRPVGHTAIALLTAAALLGGAAAASAAPATSSPEQAALQQWLQEQQAVGALAVDRPVRRPARPPRLACTPAAVTRYLRRYTALANRGRRKQLRAYFTAHSVPVTRGEEGGLAVVDANRRGFRWYTVAPTRRGLTASARRFFVARKRAQVLRYLTIRRRRGERMRLVAMTGFERLTIGNAAHAGIAFKLRRRSRDVLPRNRWRTVSGRALIDCQSGKISALSI